MDYYEKLCSSADITETNTDNYEKQKQLFEARISEMKPVECADFAFSNWDICFEDSILDYFYEHQHTITNDEKLSIISIMEKYVDSEDEFLRHIIAIILRFVSADNSPLLEKLITDSEDIVRFEALESLAKTAGVKAVDKLIEIYKTDKEAIVRVVAIRQLGFLKGINLTDLFMDAVENSNLMEIYSAACAALAEQKNKKVYKFLQRQYIRAGCSYDKACLAYALFIQGEKDKLKKLFSSLTIKGKDNYDTRYETGLFLEWIYWRSDYRTRMLILEKMKKAQLVENEAAILEEITNCLEEMEPDIQTYIQKRHGKFTAGQRPKPFFRGFD